MRITDILGGTLQRSLEVVGYWYSQSQGSIHALSQLGHMISKAFSDAHPGLLNAVQDMRQRTYLLSHAGEVEAIGRALGRPHKVFLHDGHAKKARDKKSPAGGELSHRITLYLDRIRDDIMDAVKVSAINDDKADEALDRVRRAFPKIKYYQRPKKVLHEPILREAVLFRGSSSMSVGFVDSMDWQDLVEDYQKDYVFTNRGPDGVLDEEAKIPQYQWELEQDVTQDFVHQVRDGQIDAAKENGITDFVWIAIIDDKTDECCVWRNGLTTSEISLALQSEHADDECDSDTPPAHFNCRCSIAPMTEDMPETPPSNIGDFEDWLNTTSSQ